MELLQEDTMAYSTKVLAYQAACLRLASKNEYEEADQYGLLLEANPYPAVQHNATAPLPDPVLNWDSLEQEYRHALLLELVRMVDSLYSEVQRMDSLNAMERIRTQTWNTEEE